MKHDPPAAAAPSPQLSAWSASDAELVAAAIADVQAPGAPMPEGLRAAAAETPNARLARDLREIAAAIEAGHGLQDLLTNQKDPRTRYLGALIGAAAAAENAPLALAEILEIDQSRRELWRSLRSAVAYPLILVGLTVGLVLFMEFVLVRQMRTVYDEFQIELPGATQMLIWISAEGIWWGLGLTVGMAVVCWSVWFFGGAAIWLRCISTVPLVGVLWHWSGVSQWCRLLAVVLEQRVPLPTALRLAGGGVRDANVGQFSQHLAAEAEAGRSVAQSIEASIRLPVTLVPLVRWGEQTGQLAESFRVAGEMFEGRVHMRAAILKSVFPPIIFIGVAIFVVFMLVGLYAPMLSLINALTW